MNREKRICCDNGNVGERHFCTQAGEMVNEKIAKLDYRKMNSEHEMNATIMEKIDEIIEYINANNE